MDPFHRRLAAGLIAAGLGLGVARAAPPPLEAYGKLPSIEDVEISPDGSRLASVVTDGENRFVVITPTDTFKRLPSYPAGALRLRYLQWAGPEHLIYTISKDVWVPGLRGGAREWLIAGDIDVVSHKVNPLMENIRHDPKDLSSANNMTAIFRAPMIRAVNGRPAVFVVGAHYADSKGMLSLFRYDPKTAATDLVRSGFEDAYDWVVDAAGEPLAVSEYDFQARRWSLLLRRGGAMEKVKSLTESIETPRLLGLGRDGRSVLLRVNGATRAGEWRDDLVEIAPGASDWGAPVVEDESVGLIFDPATEAWIGTNQLKGDEDVTRLFDAHDQALWDAAVRPYKGARVSLESMSADHHKLVVLVDSPTDGPAYALVDLDAHKGTWLGGLYDAATDDLAVKTPISFKAADGLALTGYLTTPKGVAAKNLPLVVFARGGPGGRDTLGFDWWAQAMASRGYAVLQVNYRGSGGFGWDFLSAGFGQFGRKMQTDLSDGVRWLAAQGAIDPRRVCIVGQGYGGYAALAGATLDPGAYRCSVSVAGISDLRRMVNWENLENGPVVKRYWLRYLGTDQPDDPRLDAISPIRHIDRVSIPILLVHGKDDAVVDLSQSQEMYDALKKAGKEAELVVLSHGDHRMLTGATRLQMLQATMAFLLKNNPPG